MERCSLNSMLMAFAPLYFSLKHLKLNLPRPSNSALLEKSLDFGYEYIL